MRAIERQVREVAKACTHACGTQSGRPRTANAISARYSPEGIMARPSKEKLLSLIDRTLGAYQVYDADPNGSNTDLIRTASLTKGTLRHVIALLGNAGRAWQVDFDDEGYDSDYEELAQLAGRLEAIKAAIEDDVLSSIEGIVLAEAFDDLLDQAEHLLSQNYHLAAGVLGRAVLEEHLRKLCDHHQCMPSKPRPTLSNYYEALDAGTHITKLERKHIEWMAGVGNHAAHNLPGLNDSDVEKLLADLRRFLALHPLP